VTAWLTAPNVSLAVAALQKPPCLFVAAGNQQSVNAAPAVMLPSRQATRQHRRAPPLLIGSKMKRSFSLPLLVRTSRARLWEMSELVHAPAGFSRR